MAYPRLIDSDEVMGLYATPRGQILIPHAQRAMYGIPEPEPPPESPVPPDALAMPVPPQDATPPPEAIDPIAGVAPGPPPGHPDAATGVPPTGPAESPSPPPGLAGASITPPQGATAGEGTPPSEAPPIDLSKATLGDVLKVQTGALGEQAKADQGVLDVQAGGLAEQQRLQNERNAAVEAEKAKFVAQEKADQENIKRTQALYEQKVQEFADKKVDRSLHLGMGKSILMALSVAMSGLGSVLKHQGDKNPALDLLMAQIQQHVDDQWKAKEDLGKQAGMARDQLSMFRDAASNTQASKNLAVAGLLEKSSRDIEAMMSGVASAEKKAAGMQVAAGARVAAGNLIAQTVQAKHAEDQQKRAFDEQVREHKAQVGLGYANLNQSRALSDRAYAEDQRRYEQDRGDRLDKERADNDLKLQKLTADLAKAKDMPEQQRIDFTKEVDKRERKIFGQRFVADIDKNGNPTGGHWQDLEQPVYGPDGKPTGAVEPFAAPSKTVADDLNLKLAAVTKLAQLTDRMQELRNKNGSEAFKTSEGRQMLINFANQKSIIKDLWNLGAMSGDDNKLTEQGMGTSDPNEWRGVSTALQEARQVSIDLVNKDLQQRGGYKGPAFEVSNPYPGGSSRAPASTDAGKLGKAASYGLEAGRPGGVGSYGSAWQPSVDSPSLSESIATQPLLNMARTGHPAQMRQARQELASLATSPTGGRYWIPRIREAGIDLTELVPGWNNVTTGLPPGAASGQ